MNEFLMVCLVSMSCAEIADWSKGLELGS